MPATLTISTPPVKVDTARLTIREVSEMTGVSVDTLEFLQFGDDGPVYARSAGRTSYAFADVLKWQRLRAADHARLMASIRGY